MTYQIMRQDLEIHGRRFYGHKNVETCAGKVHVYFNDVRDSCFILTTIMMTMRDWRVEYCGPSARDQVALCYLSVDVLNDHLLTNRVITARSLGITLCLPSIRPNTGDRYSSKGHFRHVPVA